MAPRCPYAGPDAASWRCRGSPPTTDSPRRIDAAVAAVMAHDRAAGTVRDSITSECATTPEHPSGPGVVVPDRAGCAHPAWSPGRWSPTSVLGRTTPNHRPPKERQRRRGRYGPTHKHPDRGDTSGRGVCVMSLRCLCAGTLNDLPFGGTCKQANAPSRVSDRGRSRRPWQGTRKALRGCQALRRWAAPSPAGRVWRPAGRPHSSHGRSRSRA